MATFENLSLDAFNKLCSTNIKRSDDFYEAVLKIENEHNLYFYVSMCEQDVLEAIENEKEVADALDLYLVFVDEIGIYIALYE